jgi:outer membrane murein-binding lipoprotein Lpp
MSSTSLWNRFRELSFERSARTLSPEHTSAGLQCAVAVLALGAVLLAGCDSPQRTVDSLRKQLTEFKAAPDDTKQAKIETDLAKLESQIAALEQRGDPKAEEFRKQLASLRSDYQAAKIAKALLDAKSAIEGFGQAIKDTAKSVEDAFKDSQTNTSE